MDTGAYTPTTPEQAVRMDRKQRLKQHGDFTRKLTAGYESILRQLPEDQRARARRMERRKEPKAPLQMVSGLVRDPADFRRMAAYAQTLYGTGAMHDAGVQWFGDLMSPSLANQIAMKANITRLLLSIAHDLDYSCQIRRTDRHRGGIRRMWEGSAHVPSNEGRGLAWIFCIYEPGAALYFPRYRASVKLSLGDAICFPRAAYPGISPVPDGAGARFTFESHPPPPAHQRSVLIATPPPAPASSPAPPPAA